MREQFGLLSVTLILLATCAFASEGKTEFGTCSDWQQKKPSGDEKEEDRWKQMYRIGLAHGFSFGIGAGFWGRAGSRALDDPGRRQLAQFYRNGYVQVLMRPAILMDAFDSKCADYRNVGLRLDDVGFLIILEIGGIKPERIEEAILILRAQGAGSDVLPALLK